MNMSKLFDHLRAYETDERKYIPQPLKMVDAEMTSYETKDDFAIVYRVIARLGAQVVVSAEERTAGHWETIIKTKVYRPLAEEIFGEFRQPLIDADMAIAQGEYREASKLISQVLDSMFRV